LTCQQESIADFLGTEDFRCFLVEGLHDNSVKFALKSKKNKILIDVDSELRVDGKRVYQLLEGNRHA
jgi:hypothetical protein